MRNDMRERESGVWVSVDGTDPSEGYTPVRSRDPGKGTPSSSVGLLYPRGEALGCLAIKCICDLIHMRIL